MNICFFLISGGWGGAENVVYNLAKFMEKKGHNISIILNEEEYPYFKDLKTVNLYNIGPVFDYGKFLEANFGISIPPFFLDWGLISKGLRLFLVPLLIHLNYRKIRGNVLETINEINPDVIHFHVTGVLDFYFHIYKYLDYPVIYTSHAIDFKNRINPADKLIDIRKRTLLANFDKITTVSKYMKEYLVSNGVSSNIKVIYNGLDLDYISSLKDVLNTNKNKKNTSQQKKNRFSLLFPGGGKIKKGGKELLEGVKIAKKKVPNIHLYVTREVPTNHIYREIVKNKHLENNVTFLGLLSKEEYYKYLSSVDILIIPSKNEPFGIVFLDAMAMGIPIIASGSGGVPEVVNNRKNGLLVAGDPNDIAEKILYLYNNPKLRKEISKNNIKDVEKFNWDKITDQYINLYKETIKC